MKQGQVLKKNIRLKCIQCGSEFFASRKDALCCSRSCTKKKNYNSEKHKKSLREYRKNNPEKVKKWERDKYIRDKDKISERRKDWAVRNKSRIKNYTLNRNYGISLEEYNAMLLSQNNVCAICGESKDRKSLNVDHCHKTGKVRELLCSRCNLVLGRLEDNVELVNKLSAYLQRHLTKRAADASPQSPLKNES